MPNTQLRVHRQPELARALLFEKIDGDLLDAISKQIEAIALATGTAIPEFTETMAKRATIKARIPKV
jgi:hypothetical protein